MANKHSLHVAEYVCILILLRQAPDTRSDPLSDLSNVLPIASLRIVLAELFASPHLAPSQRAPSLGSSRLALFAVSAPASPIVVAFLIGRSVFFSGVTLFLRKSREAMHSSVERRVLYLSHIARTSPFASGLSVLPILPLVASSVSGLLRTGLWVPPPRMAHVRMGFLNLCLLARHAHPCTLTLALLSSANSFPQTNCGRR